MGMSFYAAKVEQGSDGITYVSCIGDIEADGMTVDVTYSNAYLLADVLGFTIENSLMRTMPIEAFVQLCKGWLKPGSHRIIEDGIYVECRARQLLDLAERGIAAGATHMMGA